MTHELIFRTLKHVVALVLATILLTGCGQPGVQESVPTGDEELAIASAEHRSGIQVTGAGTVVRLLPDDDEEGRHQRFILVLSSGQTLLVAHNIDVAPRIDSIQPGDSIEFSGVYEWNDQGGVVHWMHRDPRGDHQPGWLKHDGRLYQ